MPPRKEKPLLSFVIDTREQLEYHFTAPRKDRFEDGGEIRYALDAGDYSCELSGELLPVRIERKSITDYFGVVGRGRDRFAGVPGKNGWYQSGPEKWVHSELERMRVYKAYLVIEATADEVKHGIERSQVSGEAALGSALCWSVSYNLNVIFAGDRRTAQHCVKKILEEFSHHWLEERNRNG